MNSSVARAAVQAFCGLELKHAEHLEDDHDNDNDSDDVEDIFVHGIVVNTSSSPAASNMVAEN